MKRKAIVYFMILLVFGILFFIKVPTKQGINYKVYTYRIPLYIKIIEFLDRDYHYKRIVNDVTKNRASDEAKVLSLFNWCVQNIKHQPNELPIIDDHPLNIIVRGYGGRDQLEDVFTILCTYAGFEAFYKIFYNSSNNGYFISFVKINNKWCPFSVYNNVYVSQNNTVLSINEIMNDPILLSLFSKRVPNLETDSFLKAVRTMEFKAKSMRVKGQNPIGRLFCYLNVLLRSKK